MSSSSPSATQSSSCQAASSSSSSAASSSSATSLCTAACAAAGVSKVVRTRPRRGMNLSKNPEDLIIPVSIFCKTFPFHFVCDHNLKLLQCGSGLTRILCIREVAFIGDHISIYFKIDSPNLNEVTFDSIIGKNNVCFILKCKKRISPPRQDLDQDKEDNKDTEDKDCIQIKGQMIHCPESKVLLFLGSPLVDGMDSMTSKGLFLSDIPIHDATRDKILVEEQSRAQESLKRRMDKLRQSIQEANQAVALERKKNVDLLYLIFPPLIAQKLWLGEIVKAESFQEVTVLFSDIVGFTSICSTSTPMMIIDMLNQLYTQFDTFCGEIDVYKIETIGDAYCVASGLHRSSEIHAQQATFMALKMIQTVQTVKDHYGQPLKMRIGLHTGPVLAGIVGQKMPRYCLFGHHVSLGNKFESTSEPLRVHISPTTYSLLSKWEGFDLTARTRDDLPKGFPDEIPGVPYFCDGYKNPTLSPNSPLDEHIKVALQPFLANWQTADSESSNIAIPASIDDPDLNI